MHGESPRDAERRGVLDVVGRVSRFTGVTTSVVAVIAGGIAFVAIVATLVLSL